MEGLQVNVLGDRCEVIVKPVNSIHLTENTTAGYSWLLSYMLPGRMTLMATPRPASPSSSEMKTIIESGNYVVRSQLLEIISPVNVRDGVRITTWYWSKGRTSVSFGHEVFKLGSNEPSVRSIVVHVCTDYETNIPTAIDFPEGISFNPSFQGQDIKRLKIQEHPPENAHIYKRIVEDSDTEMNVHVNHHRYLDFYEGAFHDALLKGHKPLSPISQYSPKQIYIEFDQESVTNDSLIIATWRLHSSKDAIGFEIYREAQEADTRKPIGKCLITFLSNTPPASL